MAQLLEGKTVVITAAAGAGIGFASAKRCLEEGAIVTISDVNRRRLTIATDELRAYGPALATAVLADVRKEADVQGLFAEAERSMGHIDVLINNAGVTIEKPLVDVTDEDWEAVLDTCLTGCFRCLRVALRGMYRLRTATVVNLASALGLKARPFSDR